jgi:hypothetical protein
MRSRKHRTYKLAPVAPEALYVTRQQAAALFGVNIQLIDKWTKDNPRIGRLRVPGRGTERPSWRVLISRADLESYLEQYRVEVQP